MSERTDRELLELAAKAAGIVIEKSLYNGGCEFGFDILGNAVLDWHNNKTWNPLTNDGDALRLAVRLELHLILLGFADVVNGADEVTIASHKWAEAVVHHDTDRYAATRRAIVLAAAEIGAKP